MQGSENQNNLRFEGKVAIVTGAGRGIGRAIAIDLAARGCKVVVNDIGTDITAENPHPIRVADSVVEEIRKAGGQALANYDSVEFGQKIVADAIGTYGQIDIVINNAGLVRDKVFHKMKAKDWEIVQLVHLKGPFMVTRAAWPHMRKNGYGRVLNIGSASGIYGNFGQANYSAAKLGVHGFTNALAKEGEAKGIFVNTIAPIAATRMTKGKKLKINENRCYG